MRKNLLLFVAQVLALVSFGQTHDSPSNSGNGGYISTGNYAGTGNAAYFPSGIYANGNTSWIYGNAVFGFGSLFDRDNKWSINPAGNSWFNGGNVGIGTTIPGAMLTIDRNMTGTPTSYMLRLINSAGTNTPTADFQVENEVGHILGLHGRSGVGNADKLIQVWNLNTGYIGIGTTSPNYKLDVKGTTRMDQLIIGESNLTFLRSPWGAGIRSNGSISIELPTQTDYNFRFDPNCFWSYKNNILLGSMNPEVTMGRIQVTQNVDMPSIYLTLNRPTPAIRIIKSSELCQSCPVYGLEFNSNSTTDVVLSSNMQGKESIKLTNNGSLTLGIPESPYSASLNVYGNILAEEVVVKLRQDWPDFVFRKDYKMLSLNDLDKYLKKNNHLPEVPSETELKKDGIDLVKMNATLLKKVEELTLYLIEQQKQIDEIKQQNINLEKKMELLNM